ncbi:MAG TPA: hypothetical protein VLK29_08360 [Luteimonas sp.]|nr:hypothetical protein [Luteimonas sp.]
MTRPDAHSAPTPLPPCAGALALELSPGDGLAGIGDRVEQDAAGAIGALIARDLAAQAADAALLDCTVVAANYDPVELLRPGWPLHATLAALAAHAPRAGAQPRVIAFGARDGHLPGALAPDPAFRGGVLRLVPFVLSGASESLARVDARLESDLMERGMAAADTALAAQAAFGLQVEHARYLTLRDLCAMTALQYGHAGLDTLWPVIEGALFAPGRATLVDTPPEPALRYADGMAHMALLSPRAWRERDCPGQDDADWLARRFAQFEARQRQWASVLDAHAIPVTFVQCNGAPADAL